MPRGNKRDGAGGLESIRLRVQREESQRKLAVGEVALGMAHDVGNVLGALQLRLQILKQDPACRRSQGANIAAMERILADASSLTQRLQALGLPAEGQFQTVDVREAVLEAISLAESGLRLQARRAGQQLRIERRLDQALPRVRVVAADLRQALVRLLIQARDGLSRGGTIRVSARRAPGEVVLRLDGDSVRGRPASGAALELRLPAVPPRGRAAGGRRARARVSAPPAPRPRS